MTVRVGINGFGRIGRSFERVLLDRKPAVGVEAVAVNEPNADTETLAFLLQHDSVAGVLATDVKATEGGLWVGGQEMAVTGYVEPAEIPRADRDVDVVVEASGRFRSRAAAAAHLAAGAQRVVVSAPGKDMDLTVCIGVNEAAYDPAVHTVVSNASCTTNCLAPMARVLDERFGIEQGFMTTVHAYTSDQTLLDQPRSGRSGKADLRRMRAAAVSIVPTSTGASRAVGEVLPQLAGRLDGVALRVPVPNGSIVDLVAILACVFSARDTMASGRMVKVLGWYDNEWGYANRLVDLVELMAS
jgi:glyceraldehyde 3-phosphate dehydrogenase